MLALSTKGAAPCSCRNAPFCRLSPSGFGPLVESGARPANLREARIAEARAIIARYGVDGLSLRDIARRLGVSHQAAYRHFPTRDALLVEIVSRAFDSFADHLADRADHAAEPMERLAVLGGGCLA